MVLLLKKITTLGHLAVWCAIQYVKFDLELILIEEIFQMCSTTHEIPKVPPKMITQRILMKPPPPLPAQCQ